MSNWRRLAGQFVGIAIAGSVGAIAASSVFAQSVIVPDETLGNERSQVIQNFLALPIEAIGGGAQRGQNLFHSFREFNVSAGRGAYFLPDASIQNILVRVTGGRASEILGTLGAFGDGRPNLFLINPNGVVFGTNASLDVQGSFAATTADGVGFGDRGVFSAVNPASPSALLTIDPSACFFNAVAQRGSIVNQSTATATVFGDPTFGLRVPNGKALTLLGGNVLLEGGQIVAAGGRVELGAVAGAGSVELELNGHLRFTPEVQRGNVALAQQSLVGVAGNNDGEIVVTADNIQVSNSQLLAGVYPELGVKGSQASNLTLDATGKIRVEQSSEIRNNVGSDSVGNAGNLIINAGSLEVTGESELSTSTFGQGNAGNVIINVRDHASFIDSGGSSSVEANATGNGGNVRISAGSLALTNAAQLITSTEGTGDAGSIIVNVRDRVTFDGFGADGKPLTAAYSRVEPGGNGKGGDIRISTDSLELTNGAQLSANTRGNGNAGNIIIDARNRVNFDGTSAKGLASGAFSSIATGAIGQGGDIRISTGSLDLTNGAKLSTAIFGTGDAGNVVINAQDRVTFDNSGADSAVAPSGNGQGGNVHISTGSLTLTSSAYLSTATEGLGDAGNVIIDAHNYVFFDDGYIFSSVQSGGNTKGGNISISTGSLTVTNGSALSALSVGGDAGNVILNVRDRAIFDAGNIWTAIGYGGSGKGGNIFISAGSLKLTNDGGLSATTYSTEDAGNIQINLRGDLQANNSSISTFGEIGSGGSITVSAKDIRLRQNSDISSFTFGNTKGGNIALTANTIIALEDSDILSFAPYGRGGNITLNTRAFFGQNYRPAPRGTNSLTLVDGNDRVDINASGTVSGVITLPDTTFIQNSLTQLSQNLTDPNTLLANSCIVRDRKQNGSFLITGSGGLPVRPGDAPPSSFPTGEVRSLPDPETQKTGNNRSWKLGDPIVEPQGIYRLPNGKLVMSRECENQ
ncbi:filamentous hemagglutinin N-terminal domain-containing protein [Phormidesmis priestleyi]|nr:filamentous hemagglutinin N-terminal domain-containing protein [Phormidesmis priestleyi]